MCIQQHELDQKLGAFCCWTRRAWIMRWCSADHGGIDLPERLREQVCPRPVVVILP
jgi:hypothetical protein